MSKKQINLMNVLFTERASHKQTYSVFFVMSEELAGEADRGEEYPSEITRPKDV